MSCADANSDEIYAILSVKVATVALSAAVAVAKLVRATAADRATVAPLTDTIAQLSSELASAQAN